MTGGQSIGASLIITRHFDRQVLNLPFFNKCYQLKNGNYRLTETLPQRLNHDKLMSVSLVSDPAAAAVAGPFLGRVQHAAGRLSGHLGAVSSLAVGAETPDPPPAPPAAGRRRHPARVRLFSTLHGVTRN